jgi:ATP-dependent RNA helicase DDX10/DBP4
MQDEASFLKDGDAATQKAKFLEEEGTVMQEADIEDKQVAKDKRREKRLAKKLREREVRTINHILSTLTSLEYN